VLGLLVCAVFFAAFLVTPASAQEFPIPTVTVSGGDLAQRVRLAPADADAFRRRVNLPPRLDDAPSATGTPYVVTTSYWASAVRLEPDEDFFDVAVEADYYSEGGFVRVDVAGQDTWMVIDLRQRAILDRYIRLANAGSIGEFPSTLDVLAAAATAEVLSIAAGGESLEPAAAAKLLRDLAEANPMPFVELPAAPDEDDGFWLTITLLEGRTLRYFYDGESLTEAMGTERYPAAAASGSLDALAPMSTPAIAQEEPAGSALWWPVMVGGGLAALSAALWLQRRRRPAAV
jgi:hypothetical protein